MGDTDDREVTGKPVDMPGDISGEYFLDRWSRRKTASRKGEADIDSLPASTAVDLPVENAATTDKAGPSPELTDDDMPPIDTLDRDSDFSVFMSPGVSEQLRTQALRKLFHMPAFNITDGLNDYDEDYTQFTGLGGVVTHEMKRLLKRELEAEDASRDEVVPVAQEEVPVSPLNDVAEKVADMDDDAEESV